MKNIKKYSIMCLMAALILLVLPFAVAAEDAPAADTEAVETVAEDNGVNAKAIAAAITVGVVATAGAVSMGVAISKTVDAIARQPEAEGKIRGAMMLGLVFIETAIIYALIVAILIIFVL